VSYLSETKRVRPAYILEVDRPVDRETKSKPIIGIALLCGLIAGAAWLASRPRQAGRFLSSVVTGFNTQRRPSASSAHPKVLPAAVARVPVPTGQTISKRAEVAPQSAVPPVDEHSGPEGSLVENRSVVPLEKPTLPPDNAFERASAEFQEARALFDREDYAAASAGFRRVIGLLEVEPNLGADLNRVAKEFAAISHERAVQEAARLYSESDPDVTPPVMLGSSLPAPPGWDTPASSLDVLEVVIDAQGAVEKARFVTTRNHYRNLWWVSAAKAWRFKPAMKNGHPVRFMTRIQIDDGEPP
jgi:hypothetical protein